MPVKTLYVCYFGLDQPLVQTQVLPYLGELQKKGVDVTLLTFEPSIDKQEFEKRRRELSSAGIDWHWLSYHKRPSAIATAWDIFAGSLFVRRFIIDHQPDILHGRVHVPTLMVAIGRKLSNGRPKVLFDIRGFFPEEYTDAGIWPQDGLLYRLAKRVERWLIKESDGFVLLTEKAREIMFPESGSSGREDDGRPVEVIPCCVDLRGRFSAGLIDDRDRFRAERGIADRLVIAHSGALGGLYLTEEIVRFLATAREREPAVYAMFLTQSDPQLVEPLLRKAGFGDADYFVDRVGPEDVPMYIAAADAGLSFVKASYATQSRSPTKIAEYLACEVPIVANRGVGDVDELIAEERVGLLVEDLTPEGYRDAFDRLCDLVRNDTGIRERCGETARRRFDLQKIGGERYLRIYRRLTGDNRESN